MSDRIVVNPKEMREAARLINTAWVELQSVRRAISWDVDIEPVDAPQRIAAEVRVASEYASGVISRSLSRLDPVAGELHRRAFWAELVDAYERNFAAPLTLRLLRHLNEITRENSNKYYALPCSERFCATGAAAEDDLFFDVPMALLGGAGIVKMLAKHGLKDLGLPLARQVAKLFTEDEGSVLVREAAFDGVDGLRLDAKLIKKLAGDVGDSSPQQYGVRVHNAVEKAVLDEGGIAWRRNVPLGKGNIADLVRLDRKTGKVLLVKIVEIKPDNPRQVRAGLKQLRRYKDAALKAYAKYGVEESDIELNLLTYVRPSE